MSYPDSYDAYCIYESQRERAEKEFLQKCPECSVCGEKITDEDCYDIGGLICEGCIEKSKVKTENYYV